MRRAPLARRLVVLPATVSVSCAVGFALVYQLTVRTAPGRLLGDASLRGAILANSRITTVVDGILGVVSVASLLAGFAAVAMIALVRLRRDLGIAAVTLLLAANASTWVLKTWLLTRPDLGLPEVTPATHNSLPSGHSTAAFSVVVALLFVVPPRLRQAVAALGAVYGTVTGLATMTAGWHRAGDSLAAFLLVGLLAGLAAILVLVLGEPEPHVGPGLLAVLGSRRWWALGSVGLVALGLALAAAMVIVDPLGNSSAAQVLAFVASGLLIPGTAGAVLLAVVVVLESVAPRRTATTSTDPDQVPAADG